MALDVGVVQIDYSVRPSTGLVEDFARELKQYDEGDTCRIASDGHVFVDVKYESGPNLAFHADLLHYKTRISMEGFRIHEYLHICHVLAVGPQLLVRAPIILPIP